MDLLQDTGAIHVPREIIDLIVCSQLEDLKRLFILRLVCQAFCSSATDAIVHRKRSPSELFHDPHLPVTPPPDSDLVTRTSLVTVWTWLRILKDVTLEDRSIVVGSRFY